MFVINADAEEEQELTMDVRGFEGWVFEEHIGMHAEKPEMANTWENPDVLTPRSVAETCCEGGKLTAVLAKTSWNVFHFIRK